MNHGVAIWAHGNQVSHWIYNILSPYLGERHAMMYVNVTPSKQGVCTLKVTSADLTRESEMRDTVSPCLWVTLIVAQLHGKCSTLDSPGTSSPDESRATD